ncbi:hypothetical protein CSA56_11930 [candidate division KSB3 bacterium]|uniref:Uncharacterized protein n=1 Tax=candidate division KSB3 bacterium TaxID=2044937 RepID=A0A2G6KEK4_9BACT|nr:MAG: hypothetical protein CSA56_11930 [candidate division KSB3 bacterium]
MQVCSTGKTLTLEIGSIAVLACIAICLILLTFQAYRKNEKGINPFLLLVCCIGALLIPSVSHDYKFGCNLRSCGNMPFSGCFIHKFLHDSLEAMFVYRADRDALMRIFFNSFFLYTKIADIPK